MGFKCGIVGLPNVGKSTLFNALTSAGVDAANYPFCTIEPNVGNVAVPDLRLRALADIVKPQRVLPTTMQFVDIAGLVAGASKGEGLGNQFLSHIRETDAIAHVVRCFHNDDIAHVAGQVDPIADIETIQLELAIADVDHLQKSALKIAKLARSGDKQAVADNALVEKVIAHLNQGLAIRTLTLSDDDRSNPVLAHCITQKPMLYVANVDEQGFEDNPLLHRLQEYAAREHVNVVVICAAMEAEIALLDDADKHEFLASLGLNEPGLDRLIRAGYGLLGLQTYFTAGVKEVRAWTIPLHATAPQAAGKIHTDFEKGFIRAEVIAYDDFIRYHGEQGAKEVGKLRVEGKTYLVHDGDVMHFLFNV